MFHLFGQHSVSFRYQERIGYNNWIVWISSSDLTDHHHIRKKVFFEISVAARDVTTAKKIIESQSGKK